MDILHTTQRMCFMGVAINRNNKVIPHKDVKDLRDRYWTSWSIIPMRLQSGDVSAPALTDRVQTITNRFQVLDNDIPMEIPDQGAPIGGIPESVEDRSSDLMMEDRIMREPPRARP
ncbi:hypothetical protein MMC07_008025 [Pseudocyphellaria aurata]|nr:hypothetical protein [Pseudocyphellaria aurata]